MSILKGTQRGYSLIELMIVVAIIGTLSMLVIPIYQNYMARSQVSEAVSLGGFFKVPLAEYGANNDDWPTAIVSSEVTTASTEIAGTLRGKYSAVTPSVSGVYPGGVITVTMSGGRAGGTILFVTADGGATWNCSSGTVEARFRPQSCR